MTVQCERCGQGHCYKQYFRGTGYRDVLEYNEFRRTYITSVSYTYSRRKPLFCYNCYSVQKHKFKKLKGVDEYTLSDIARMENAL